MDVSFHVRLQTSDFFFFCRATIFVFCVGVCSSSTQPLDLGPRPMANSNESIIGLEFFHVLPVTSVPFAVKMRETGKHTKNSWLMLMRVFFKKVQDLWLQTSHEDQVYIGNLQAMLMPVAMPCDQLYGAETPSLVLRHESKSYDEEEKRRRPSCLQPTLTIAEYWDGFIAQMLQQSIDGIQWHLVHKQVQTFQISLRFAFPCDLKGMFACELATWNAHSTSSKSLTEGEGGD